MAKSKTERGRFSSRKKMEIVLRVLRGDDLDLVSREAGMTAATVFAAVVGLPGIPVFGADEAVLRPRVPIDQIELVRTWSNPLPATQETIEKGKQLFHGKAFCMTCHGKDGRGWGGDIEPGPLKGPLPRNFTDKEWQAARTDGALFWINSVPTFVSARLETS